MRHPIQWLRTHPEMRRVLIIWAIITVILWIMTVTIPTGLNGLVPVASERTSDQVLTEIVFTLMADFVVAFVWAIAGYALFAFASRRGRPRLRSPQFTASRAVIFAWVGATTLLSMLLYTWGLVFLARADAYPAPGGRGNASNILNIDVLGEQWQWDFTYPQYGNAQSEILEVPVNRPIYFTITSADVVHSFKVSAFGIEEDAVPGEFTHIRVMPNAMGAYSLRCYELCGTYHSYMEAPVYVVSDADFTKWVNSQNVHGYPWPINGAGRPKPASPYPGNDLFPQVPNGPPNNPGAHTDVNGGSVPPHPVADLPSSSMLAASARGRRT